MTGGEQRPAGDRFADLWADVEVALQEHGYRPQSAQARSRAFFALHALVAAYEGRDES